MAIIHMSHLGLLAWYFCLTVLFLAAPSSCQIASTPSQLTSLLAGPQNPIYIAAATNISLTASLGTIQDKTIIGLGGSVLDCGHAFTLATVGPNLKFQDLTISNCGSPSGSTAFVITGTSSLTLDNVTMTACRTSYYGSCIYGESGSVSLKNVVIDGCLAALGGGGAIFVQDAAKVRIENSTFSCPENTGSVIRANVWAANANWEFAGDIKFVGNQGTLIHILLQQPTYEISFLSDPENPSNFLLNHNSASRGFHIQYDAAGKVNMTFSSIIATQTSIMMIPFLTSIRGELFIKGDLLHIQGQLQSTFAAGTGLPAAYTTIDIKNITILNSSPATCLAIRTQSTITCDTLKVHKCTLGFTKTSTLNATEIDFGNMPTSRPLDLTGPDSILTVNIPGTLKMISISDGAMYAYNRATIILNVEELLITNSSRANRAAITALDSQIHINSNRVEISNNLLGGAISATGSLISFKVSNEIVFQNNTISSNSGPLRLISSILELNASSILFQDNRSFGSGGAVYGDSESGLAIDATNSVIFEGNRADVNGGAIDMENSSRGINITTKELIFKSNNATGHGGALYLANSEFICRAENVTFTSCSSSNNGGAICAIASSNLTFDGFSAIFELNQCGSSGGALYLDSGSRIKLNSMNSSSFLSNRADIGGAVKAFGDDAQSQFLSSSFYNNTARQGCFLSMEQTTSCPLFSGDIISNRGGSPYTFASCSTIDAYCFRGCISQPLPCALCGERGSWRIPSECAHDAFVNNSTQVLFVSSTAPVFLVGNVSIDQIQITGSSEITSKAALITSDGCLQVGRVDLTLSENDVESLGKRRELALINSTCKSIPILSVKVESSCKRARLTVKETQDSETFQLNAVFEVDNSVCNRWWIILVSVLGGVILIVILILLLYKFTSLKTSFRPFSSANS